MNRLSSGFDSRILPQDFWLRPVPEKNRGRQAEVNKMSKANGTAASQAHAPESKHLVDQPHAHKYPGTKTGKVEKNSGAVSHDAKALAAGRANSMGASANGSHKGLPSSYEYIGHPGYDVKKEAGITSPEQSNDTPKHEPGKVAAGRKNSIGVSADGSHKSFPGTVEQIGQ